jgi:signal transduction histidine kinase
MPDYYQVPALILTALLLPAFGYLYLRYRDARTLLWFLGFLFSLCGMVSFYVAGGWGMSLNPHRWLLATGQASVQISAALFLASLSPLRFRLGRLPVWYFVPYALPLVVASVLFYGVFGGVEPPRPLDFIFPALGAVCFVTAVFWCARKHILPRWLSLYGCVMMGGLVFWALFTLGTGWALSFVVCANFLVTALLMIFVFRRFSPGLLLSVTGLLAWSLYFFQAVPAVAGNPSLDIDLVRIIVMGKVVAALGMIVLILEDELAMNKAAREREQRARRELEAYSKLMITRRRVDEFDRQGSEICEIVVEHSRFSQAALLLHSSGRYRLAGSAGLDGATAKALSGMAARIPATGFLADGTAPSAVEQSQTLRLDLTPWLWPGDDLKRLHFTSTLAVPMTSRSSIEGALLLSGLRPIAGKRAEPEPLRADDLLPIELLVGRLQATRNQTRMFEKLIDSEKFAHLGQLAGNVSQQLNNPLTVVLGYASLLEETASLESQDRKAIEAILTEARHMRGTLESLARISRPYGDELAAVSVAELLSDMGELHRTEFLRRSIEFRLSIAPALPRVLCSAQQLRQAVRHCLQFAMDAVDTPTPNRHAAREPKTIRMEAASEGNLVQILVGHSGLGFPNPERAFDPFASASAEGEAATLGLSLCATILRDNNGRALAVNLEPHGAAIILELRSA